MEVTVSVSVRDNTDIAETRRQADALAGQLEFNAVDAGRASIVATELATNLIRHGGGGEILLDADGGLRFLALDKGPGMVDVQACLRDGYSTGGTRGEGLGAVQRQTEAFEIYSRPGLGTAVLARVNAQRAGQTVTRWAGVSVAYPGEMVSGDAWAVRVDGGVTSLIIADGLGHGLLAHEASKAALASFDRHGARPLTEVLEYAHAALRPTRGAAASVARVRAGSVEFAGVGNVAGVVVSAGVSRRMISHNGTLGHIAKRFQTFSYPVQEPVMLIIHSDGLGSSLSLDKYPGLALADPALIAAVLYRDFTRGRDNATVLVLRG